MEIKHAGLYTDFYELTMMQGFFLDGRADEQATFDYFFRKNPFGGSYTVFAGLSDLLSVLENITFEKEDLAYLKSQGFKDGFLDYLSDFKFSADVYAVKEGELIFPEEPVVSIRGNIAEAQLVETLVLNLLNYQSLIATKAARIRHAAGEKVFIDFGMRRAQGTGAVAASKAAIIGGANATSNVISGYEYNVPVSGTMAHSWIQSYPDELKAFRKFARFYADNSILLVDTYDTLNSGIPNAIKVAKEMVNRGEKLNGVRLDSGDLAKLSKESRKMLDEAGLDYVKIIVSNQQDEFTVQKLLEEHAPIDGFGIGTNLLVGRPDAALDGVYKLTAVQGKPSLKLSDNPAKTTIPGSKKICRFFDENDQMVLDALLFSDEKNSDKFYTKDGDEVRLPSYKRFSMLTSKVMENGSITNQLPTTMESAEFASKRIVELPERIKTLNDPDFYQTALSQKLLKAMQEEIEKQKDIHL